MKKIFTLVFLAAIAFQSCKKEEVDPEYCWECIMETSNRHGIFYSEPEIICGMTNTQRLDYQRLNSKTTSSSEVKMRCTKKD